MMPSRQLLSGAFALRLRRLRPRDRVCLPSSAPLPDRFMRSGARAHDNALRRATHPDASGCVGVRNPTPLAGSCCSLDAARRSSGFAAGNAAAAFRTSSVSSVVKEPQHPGVATEL